MPAAIDGQGSAGDIGVIQQITQALVDHLGSGLDAQCGFCQRLGAVRGIVVRIEQHQRRGDAVDFDAWRQFSCE